MKPKSVQRKRGRPTRKVNPAGRPKKGDGPRIPYDALDRLLVHGEVVQCKDGVNTMVVYPSMREIADRLGVSHTSVQEYARTRNCLRRREVAQARVEEKADQKLVELRATARAVSRDEELRIIDSFLLGFERALAEGRVRHDNPTDFNTMIRLKQFLQGGADSRQEVHARLTLEDIQERHQNMMRVMGTATVVEADQASALPAEEAGSAFLLEPFGEETPPQSGRFSGHFEAASDGSNTPQREQFREVTQEPSKTENGKLVADFRDLSELRRPGSQGAVVAGKVAAEPSTDNAGTPRATDANHDDEPFEGDPTEEPGDA